MITDEKEIVKLAEVGDNYVITGKLENNDSTLKIVNLKATVVPQDNGETDIDEYK